MLENNKSAFFITGFSLKVDILYKLPVFGVSRVAYVLIAFIIVM